MIKTEKINIGSKVKLKCLSSKKIVTYKVIKYSNESIRLPSNTPLSDKYSFNSRGSYTQSRPHVTDYKEGEVSINSKVGKILNGKSIGDIVRLEDMHDWQVISID